MKNFVTIYLILIFLMLAFSFYFDYKKDREIYTVENLLNIESVSNR